MTVHPIRVLMLVALVLAFCGGFAFIMQIGGVGADVGGAALMLLGLLGLWALTRRTADTRANGD
jgi:hypothetical protein